MSTLVIGIVGILALLLLLYQFQSALIFFPRKDLVGTPASIGIPFESLRLKTSDGVSISAWYVESENPRATILFCHGNGGNISYSLEVIDLFHSMRFNVLVFDYRGYGESGGTPDEQGMYQDALAAWEYLVRWRGIPPGEIVVVGRSLGGAVAGWLATEVHPRAVVLESAFTSLADIGSTAYPFLPVRLLLRYSYPTVEYVRQLQCPLLVVHSPGDEIIPFSHGERLFAEAVVPKEFLEISGGHNDGFALSEEQYREGIQGFLERKGGL